MKIGDYFGIDFGTTNTSVVRIRNEQFGRKTMILGDNGGFPFASLIAFSKDKTIMFGNEVKSKRESLGPDWKIISSFKSLLGTDEKVLINNKKFTPVQIVTEYLKCIKSYINKAYGIDIQEASFSFPVDFSPEARKDLHDAAENAGITVSNLVTESTAAYLACMQDLKAQSNIMVIDWGGGTLDVSILEVRNNKVHEISVFGKKIGGDDIDKEMAERIHAYFSRQVEPDKRVAFEEMPGTDIDRLRSICESAKIDISDTNEDYPLSIRNYGTYGTKNITITVEMFEEIVKPIIIKKVLSTVDSAMNRAGISKTGIDAVVIAGGSSNLKPFADAIVNLFDEDKIVFPDKIQSVSAEGAALMPFINGNFKLNDDIGILMSDNTVFPILKKDIHGVGDLSEDYTFSLVEDAPDAHFIITNGDGRIIYAKENIPTKGFLKERLEVLAHICKDQTVTIRIKNPAMSDDKQDHIIKISKLTYHYDLSGIKD